MSERWRWRDAHDRLQALTPGERRALLLLSRLPLLWADALGRIGGLGSAGTAHEIVGRLRAAGLVGSLQASFRSGRSPALLYLTDLGLAVVALVRGMDPVPLARHSGLRGSDLLAQLPGLPQLVACYEVLAGLCASRAGDITALAWERPWRRQYYRRTAKAPLAVALPAGVELWREGRKGSYLLLPDLATFPVRAYRAALTRLVELRACQGGILPTVVIATADAGRASAWRWLLGEVRRARGAAPLAVCLATWDDLAARLAALPVGEEEAGVTNHPRPSGQTLRRGVLRPHGSLPRPVGSPFGAAAAAGRPGDRLGRLALELAPVERGLLDLVGRHPFLMLDDLAAILGWRRGWALRRRHRLLAHGLLRLLGPREAGDAVAALGLAELTPEGLAIVAAQQGLSLPAAVRYNGLAGGGPDHPVGARRSLARNLAHTRGVNNLFAGLYHTARALARVAGGDAVVEWQSAAACARRHVRPDGYGIYRRRGEMYGFFLEYDRGTMSAADLREKFAAYHEYLASRRYEEDYVGFPTVLVVGRDNATEERVARVVRAVAVGRLSLPVLLTCEWRLADPRNPHGLLGPIWREPGGSAQERRAWPHSASGNPPTQSK